MLDEPSAPSQPLPESATGPASPVSGGRVLLPPPIPDPVFSGSRRHKPTLIIWLALVTAFFAIWQFLSPGREPSPNPASLSPFNSDTGCCLGLLVLLAGGLALVRFVIARFSDYGGFNLAHESILLAMAERRWEQALAQLSQITPRYRRKPIFHSLSLLYTAHAELWSGRLDAAIATTLLAERGAGSVASNDVRTMASADLAILYALWGDLAEARRWVEEGRSRLARNRGNRLLYAIRLWVAECLMAARRGLAAECLALIEQHRPCMFQLLNANAMRMLEVVGAFAANDAQRLARVAPTSSGEFAFLGTRWPEMQAFLTLHGLRGVDT